MWEIGRKRERRRENEWMNEWEKERNGEKKVPLASTRVKWHRSGFFVKKWFAAFLRRGCHRHASTVVYTNGVFSDVGNGRSTHTRGRSSTLPSLLPLCQSSINHLFPSIREKPAKNRFNLLSDSSLFPPLCLLRLCFVVVCLCLPFSFSFSLSRVHRNALLRTHFDLTARAREIAFKFILCDKLFF